jgi:hypothetical protein
MKIMKNKSCIYLLFYLLLSSCDKDEAATNNECAGKNIIITTLADSALNSFSSSGKITVIATGSTGFSYKLSTTGTYGSSNIFPNLSPNTYTVFVKDSAGCENSKLVTVPFKVEVFNPCAGTPGPKFNAVKNLMINRCNYCHRGGSSANGGLDLSVDCNIVNFKAKIKIRAVDQGNMPPGGPALSADDKQKITDWINAGGRITD